MSELHASMYAPLITYPTCDMCPGYECDNPHWVTNKGQFRTAHGDLPGCAVWWPSCPRNFQCLRAIGEEYRSLSDVVEWGIELGWHKDPLIGWGASKVYREYFLRKDHMTQLLSARDREDSE